MAPAPSKTLNPSCDWPISYAECPILGPEQCWTPAAKALWETQAATYLWQWTGRAFGLCEVEVRPCRSECAPLNGYAYGGWGGDPLGQWMWGPVLVGGQWFNLACGWCGDLCSCSTSAATALKLPGPIDSIVSVTIDGVAVDPEAYRVDNATILVRQDGQAWPTCQDMALPADEPGTWSVKYLRGTAVPLGGQVAAGMLAVELAKAACGDTSCQLPRRVQSITRQGVTVAILDAFEDVEKGHTGVWLIDSWVASVVNAPRRGTVRSPDVPKPRHRVTTAVAVPAPPPP